MEKLTRHTSFAALKADVKSDNSALKNKKMVQFEELLALMRRNITLSKTTNSDGK
ncbi:hypothetical protein [Hymenobacter weizhouensis]|uniref:hypothetical protein n=1 Tax=Hymenobacter sp. YIM 151500-1 TaxID=2987689 RepID=UPI002226D946|nr:hypothetical protein [Hymenobacter sp. YIM 151500-1]UYZ64268.1 hypothetical protein OIS53_05315 [Hymenobacter sp. YIM 151500-1]